MHDLAPERPDLVEKGLAILERWSAEEMARSPRAVDPLWTVIREGGPHHARYGTSAFEKYLKRLVETGRSEFAELLAERERL